MKERLSDLLKVKSIITLCVMGVYVYLAVSEKLDTAMVSSVITAVITYYFMKDTPKEKRKEIKSHDDT